MIITTWRGLLGRMLLVFGLVAGPWPAAIAASASTVHDRAAMQPMMDDDTPCPMDQRAATPPCHCCDDGAPCSVMQCTISTPAPGLPVGATSIAMIPDVAIHDADRFIPPPDPRPGERLRPPIA